MATPSPSERQELFPKTRWTLVDELRHGETMSRDAASARLCEIYWRPLYIHLRSKGRGHHDAEDMVQSFLAKACRTGLFSKPDAQRGKLRTLLLTCLQNFERDEYRKASAERRGGDSTIVSFDLESAERQVAAVQSAGDGHGSSYDVAWAVTLMATARDRLVEEYAERGNGELCEAMCPLLTSQGTKSHYEQLGEKFGKSGSAVKMELSRMRRRFGSLLHETVAETVSDEDDINHEVSYLLELASQVA